MAVAGAGVLIVRPGPEVLAITRGFDVDDLGFPGGTSDPSDQNARYTATRELYEETGIVVSPEDLRYVRHTRTRTGRLYVLFAPETVRMWPKVLQSQPFEGYVGWVDPHQLKQPSARHHRFQKRVLDDLGL